MEKFSRVKALVDLDAVAYNFEAMHKNIKPGTKMIAVVKADAYGPVSYTHLTLPTICSV